MGAAEVEGKKSKSSSAPVHAVAVLSRDGSRIFLGQGRGIVAVLDTQTLLFLDAFKVTPLQPCSAIPCFLHMHMLSIHPC